MSETILKDLAKMEANYYSNIQYPVEWVSVENKKDLKIDINLDKRSECYNHHEWGFIKGWNACKSNLLEENEELKRKLEIAKRALELIDKECSRDDSRGPSIAWNALEEIGE